MDQNPELEQTLRMAAEAAQGWLSFDAFMELALLHPSQGYYARTDRPEGPFGSAGDFLTAPEMGPWMGAAVAQAFVRLQRSSPAPLSICELGPGTGALAAQVLTELAELDCLPQAYWLDEPSAHLRSAQRATLERAFEKRPDADTLRGRCQWTEDGRGRLPSIHGLVLAHEVLDALPVRLFQWHGHDEPVLEWGLVWDPVRPGWSLRGRPAVQEFAQMVQDRARAAEALGGWMPGHRCEIAPGLALFLDRLWQGLVSGSLVLIDYGYERHELDHPDRHGGTLAAHLAHRRLDAPEDWIVAPGSRDLTAHVDFTAVAQRLAALGAASLSLKSQAAWLLDHGVLHKAQSELFSGQESLGQPPGDLQQLRALSGLQTLLSDGAMGQRFLVLTAAKPVA